MVKKYKASMTSAGFLLLEIKKVAKLKTDGYSNDEIKNIVFNKNIFQYKKTHSIKKICSYTIRRCDSLTKELVELLNTETLNNTKLINLLAIMEEDILFKDFIIEEVGYCYKASNLLFGKINVNRFFNNKIEQGTNVANFSEITINKLRQFYLKILLEAGLLSSIKDGVLHIVHVDKYLKNIFIENGYEYFINLLEGN